MTDATPDNAGPRDDKGRFKPGQSGNPNGMPSVQNKRSRQLRDSILNAANKVGLEIDPDNDDGLEAFLAHCARSDIKSFLPLLGKVLPLIPTKIALPAIETVGDAVKATGSLVKAVGDGELSPAEASAVAGVIGAAQKSIELVELARRMDELEARLSERK